MPFYEYEHIEEACKKGEVFEVEQWINDWPLTKCPFCGGPVRKLMSVSHIKKRKTDSELRDAGFTKLVHKGDGIYENVTVREGESKIVDRKKPETLPHLHKIITD